MLPKLIVFTRITDGGPSVKEKTLPMNGWVPREYGTLVSMLPSRRCWRWGVYTSVRARKCNAHMSVEAAGGKSEGGQRAGVLSV